MNLSGVDLNLLWVLHVMLEEGSVRAAAERLGLTSPAVSNALGRLRQTLDDPLFVRSGRGLIPTSRATALAPILARAVQALAEGLAPAFNPATCEQTLTLALSDAEMLTLLPTLTTCVHEQLPRAHLNVVTLDTLTAAGGLSAEHIDATIGPEPGEQSGMLSRFLYEETACLIARRDHPRLRKSIDAQQFNAEKHVDIHLLLGSPGAGNRTTRDAMKAAGLQRHIAVTVPTFFAAAMVVAHSDFVSGLPRRVAQRLREPLGLQLLDSVGSPPKFRMALIWHERTDNDPAASMLRAAVERAVAGSAHGQPATPRSGG